MFGTHTGGSSILSLDRHRHPVNINGHSEFGIVALDDPHKRAAGGDRSPTMATTAARDNPGKSGVGGSLGRTGLRVGIEAAGKKYFSVGLPGTGLSHRTTFWTARYGRGTEGVEFVAAAALFLAILVFWVVRSR